MVGFDVGIVVFVCGSLCEFGWLIRFDVSRSKLYHKLSVRVDWFRFVVVFVVRYWFFGLVFNPFGKCL